MPVYAYKGVSHSGKSIKGTIDAENPRAARAKMRTEGVFLTDISETGALPRTTEQRGKRSFEINVPRRIPAIERAVATRQLATLITAGIPLVEALGALVEQIENRTLKSVFSQVRERVNEGSSLADALKATGRFDTLYLSMVRAGEAGGALGTVMNRIADYLEDQVRLNTRVTSIMVYPAAMLCFATLVVIALVTLVLPQITSLLLSLDQELPWYTVAVITGSDFVRSWWWALALGGAGGFLGFKRITSTARGRAAFDRLLLRIPVIGRVTRVVAIARFTRTLSSLLSGGVSIIKSLEISRHVANNAVIAAAIDTARTAVLEGSSLATPLRASRQFPPMVITMIEVGERAGELDSMLAKVAETYDEQVEATITRLTSLLEPMLILLMVGIVLVIILATLTPMLEITNSLN